MRTATKSPSASTIALAGLAGGLAEVVWVGLYCALTPLDGATVAQEVALAVRAGFVPDSLLGASGLLVHFALALVVAFAFAAALGPALRRGLGAVEVYALATFALLGIWAINFFVLLPQIAPAFVALMPLGVTAASKVLFGLAMAAVIRSSAPAPAHAHARAFAHR